ncbi:hypothetical protein AC579_5114 [Pseudocercospora musae]|uniref:Nucleoporin Pom152 n=1 Tax=Pseudocercospora musae TaxID=113226 RepID=A0A139IP23_9PEZI|nr:hypothetical protein AC579_5114 [Pseudocercospora musae]
MERTPRPRTGAWPNTPQPRDTLRQSDAFRRQSPASRQKPLPHIPTLKTAPSPPSEPLIPTHIIDAPTQRLYATAFWVALCTWRIYDYLGLQESDEQSLWLFMKWVAMDGVFLFGLPGLRIPWLEWSSATMTFIFLAHAIADAMLMFRIPIPIMAAFTALWRGVWGAYETAVNEHNVNPESVLFNDSLILGRQVIHILPEGSAIMNPEREAFCVDQTRTEVKLPITINATEPIGMEIVHVDLETQANSTLQISKSQLKQMHKEASRLLTYSDDPDKPKTLYYTVKKPGIYVLSKVVDASNLEVSRKSLAHTVVVPCPRVDFPPIQQDTCRGDVSKVQFEVTGTPPMKVKYRKRINKDTQQTTFENIQPEDFVSPLLKADHNSLVVPRRMDTEWAKARKVAVPLSEGLTVAGEWMYAIDEIVDGFGNKVRYSNRDQAEQEKRNAKYTGHNLHQVLHVHERPSVELAGCTPQRPMKVAKGRSASLPVKYGSTGRGPIKNTSYHLEYMFSPQRDMTTSEGHSASPQTKKVSMDSFNKQPQISEPGLYTLTGVSSDFCSGDVLEPASCLLQNPPEPELKISHQNITDQCAGRAIGLVVDLDLTGTPPFEVSYKMVRTGDRHHKVEIETINGLRGQLQLTPREAGKYTYEFDSISDAVYHNQKLPKSLKIEQTVNPSASATFASDRKQTVCIDQAASFRIQLSGEGPFKVDYEIVHNGKRKAQPPLENVAGNMAELPTPVLRDGGEYTVSLVSITDGLGCKEFLKDEAKISVRHQKPKVGFGLIEGRRTINVRDDTQVSLPMRLTGEGPWTVSYIDAEGKQHTAHPRLPNDHLQVAQSGMYELTEVSDSLCPGIVDDAAKGFQVDHIPRPELRIADRQEYKVKGSDLYRSEVCEGDEDAVDVLFGGAPPWTVSYIETVKPLHGAVAPKNQDIRAAVNRASLRMDTSMAGTHEYKFVKLRDHNYDHSARHFTPMTIHQTVHSRPSAAFTSPGKTYSFCSVESEGEQVIPVTLHGQPPFALEVEIKHQGTVKPELISWNDIASQSHNIRIPHSRLHLGKSSISLRRVSDARGCSRSLDSTTPRVQISVHDAPTVTSLEERTDYCVGDRLNFALSGVAPFTVLYSWNGQARKAAVASGNTFRRLAEKPGEFVITGLQDSASTCKSSTNITKHIHGMPSVRVSKGKDSYIDIHEGGQAEILFEFGGTPPFEFTYTRSANTEKRGKKAGQLLDMRSEVSDEYAMKIWASEEGTYEVVSIKDAHCSYAKPGVPDVKASKQKKLGYY